MEAKVITFTMRLEESVHKKIKILAVERGVSVKAMLTECIQRMLAEEEAKKK